MNITKEQLVAGYPSIQVRNFLRRFRKAIISASTVQNALKLSTAEAERFLPRLTRLGLLEPSKYFSTKCSRLMKSALLAWHWRMHLLVNRLPGRQPIALYKNSWIV